MNQNKSGRDPLQAFKAATLAGVVFFSAFGFSQVRGILPIGFNDVMLLLAQPFIMGFMYAMSFGKGRLKFVAISSLGLTGLGMIFRYIMDLGTTANSLNFTPVNMLLYLGYMTLLISLTYLLNSEKPMRAAR